MEQKQVKIIGLKLNEGLGILQSCELKFDQNSNLIQIKGEVGSGKSTLQKSLRLGTEGSKVLDDDKFLYGKIDQEVQLLDGDINIYVGCKTTKKGGLDYVIYTKDINGKIVKDPVIDGVKLTPASYLKNLQTELTWRMDEITSESATVQKNILLQLYKSELIRVGVIFDKDDPRYMDSILGKIDLAENDRTEKDYLRKNIGGFANHLEPLGIDVDDPETIPKRIDLTSLENKKTKFSYDIDHVSEAKKQKLSEFQNKADAVVLKLKEENVKIREENKNLSIDFEEKKNKYSQNIHTFNGIITDLGTLNKEACLSEEAYKGIKKEIERFFINEGPVALPEKKLVEFDEDGKCTTKEWEDGGVIGELLFELAKYKDQWIKVFEEEEGDTSSLEKELEMVINDTLLAKENNKKCDMVDTYVSWRGANTKVTDLKNEYAKMLASVDTGVPGLIICVNSEEGVKMEIYLTYDGSYDTKYFNNPDKESRKLSSYSGTQKPLICLLLQNYLLSMKPKAMRYLWIDNIPIDSKTKKLLNQMGKDLGLTIFVNITGDFGRDSLEKGEILIEGGEIFFK